MNKKKYLKFALVTLTSISPLSVVIACGKKDNKGKEVASIIAVLTKAKTKFQNTNSTKLKTAINLSSISKGDEVKASEIGYETPKDLPKGITTKYTLEKGWYINNNLEQFQIKVTLKKENQEDTQIITITAKTPTLQTEINKFKDQQSSMFKNKMESLPNVGQPVQVATIGYTPPKLSRGFSATYKIKKGWFKKKIIKGGWITSATNIAQFEIEVIIKKDDNSKETQKKDVKIRAKIDVFASELNKFKDADSSKTWKLITDSLKGKGKGDRISPADIGYIEPTIDKSFKRFYILAENLDSISKKVKVKVVLKKYGEKSKEVQFQVSPKVIDFTTEKNKIISQISTTSWKNILNILTKNLAKRKNADISKLIDSLGVTHKISPEFKATYKLAEDLDKNLRKIKIEVMLEKDGDKSENTIFELSAQVFSFDAIKNSFQKPWKSSKTMIAIMKFLSEKKLKENDKITKTNLENIGIQEPHITDNGVEIVYTIKEINQTDEKIKIEVAISKDGQKSEPISFEISPNIIDFQTELDKFKSPTMSKKTKDDIEEALKEVQIETLPSATIPQIIGYDEPKLSLDFKTKFQLERQTGPNLKLKITLEKDGKKSIEKTIEIQPNTDIPILKKFNNQDTIHTPEQKEHLDKGFRQKIVNMGSKSAYKRLIDTSKGQEGYKIEKYTVYKKMLKVEKADLEQLGYKWPENILAGKTPHFFVEKVMGANSSDAKIWDEVTIIAKLGNYIHHFIIRSPIINFETLKETIPKDSFFSKTKQEILNELRKIYKDSTIGKYDIKIRKYSKNGKYNIENKKYIFGITSTGRLNLQKMLSDSYSNEDLYYHEHFPIIMGFNPNLGEKYKIHESAIVYKGKDLDKLKQFIEATDVKAKGVEQPELNGPFWVMMPIFKYSYDGVSKTSASSKYEPFNAEDWINPQKHNTLFFVRWPLDTYHFLQFSKLQKKQTSKTMNEIVQELGDKNKANGELSENYLKQIIENFPTISSLLTAKYTLVEKLDATKSTKIKFKVTLSKDVEETKNSETKTTKYTSEEAFEITAKT